MIKNIIYFKVIYICFSLLLLSNLTYYRSFNRFIAVVNMIICHKTHRLDVNIVIKFVCLLFINYIKDGGSIKLEGVF